MFGIDIRPRQLFELCDFELGRVDCISFQNKYIKFVFSEAKAKGKYLMVTMQTKSREYCNTTHLHQTFPLVKKNKMQM